ncbi:undecaprenyldiphospho-muramoylpentapeptide beta-N-acetylglucosaminyltransferase [bacterium]|nr:MAG: undecaprenyldiphospho-muramoylpentapeptide beta-N-acetylglucosaminyltransferase [bacterium]
MKAEPSAIKVLIASGASAGHLYPALAFAQRLAAKRPDIAIAFVTSKRGIESAIERRGYHLFFVSLPAPSLKGIKFLRSLYYLCRSFFDSFFIIQKFRPGLVVGFGSYVSFPALLESALLGIPTLIHEQNVSFGLSNKLLSFFADKIAVSFKNTPLRAGKRVFTGNPLRSSLTKSSVHEARRFFGLEGAFTLLVVGGSQGSRRINMEFAEAVRLFAERKERFQFIHISGRSDYLRLKECYKCITIKYCLFDFLDAINLAYGASDLVICRAGAGTLSELAYFKKAAVVIPYPHARGHQLENAIALKNENAAVVIQEKELSGAGLREQILRLIRSADERKALEDNIQKFAYPEAADKLAELALSMVK